MPRPICVRCRVEFRCEKNGVVVNDPEANGFPASYWKADRYGCPCCGALIIVGFSRESIPDEWVHPGMKAESLEFRRNP